MTTLQQLYRKRLPWRETWVLVVAAIVAADLAAFGAGAAVLREVFPWVPIGSAITAVHLGGMLLTRRWWAARLD